jgi:anti-sigma B factor antagonist
VRPATGTVPDVDAGPPHLRIRLELADGVCLLGVAGDVDVATSTELKRALDDAFEADPPPRLVRADLSGIGFLDTTGLGLLLVARRRAADLGARFVVSSSSPVLDRLFEVTGVATVLRED